MPVESPMSLTEVWRRWARLWLPHPRSDPTDLLLDPPWQDHLWDQVLRNLDQRMGSEYKILGSQDLLLLSRATGAWRKCVSRLTAQKSSNSTYLQFYLLKQRSSDIICYIIFLSGINAFRPYFVSKRQVKFFIFCNIIFVCDTIYIFYDVYLGAAYVGYRESLRDKKFT